MNADEIRQFCEEQDEIIADSDIVTI